MFEYEKVTITRVRISTGFILTIVVIILIAANHKSVGPAVHTATEILKWTLISLASVGGLGALYGIYKATRALRKMARKAPKTITLYPTYVLNNEPVAGIEPPRTILNGVPVSKVTINSRYGK